MNFEFLTKGDCPQGEIGHHQQMMLSAGLSIGTLKCVTPGILVNRKVNKETSTQVCYFVLKIYF